VVLGAILIEAKSYGKLRCGNWQIVTSFGRANCLHLEDKRSPRKRIYSVRICIHIYIFIYIYVYIYCVCVCVCLNASPLHLVDSDIMKRFWIQNINSQLHFRAWYCMRYTRYFKAVFLLYLTESNSFCKNGWRKLSYQKNRYWSLIFNFRRWNFGSANENKMATWNVALWGTLSCWMYTNVRLADWLTSRQTHRQTDRQTDTQTDRHTDRQTDRQTDCLSV
jgi:hypothetical protein